ncbi:MAG: T9SS type A sorting domain-containing protein [Bacteroidia bacterium]|nr:T9SS type A sorting domain-containing protein [Bacteroidia bacterium]
MNKVKFGLFLLVLACFDVCAQVSYNAAKIYSLRKVVPTYTGSAISIRRSCDNATANIGFTSCGDLDTAALKLFVIGYNPLSAVTVTSVAMFSLRKLSCAYSGNCIRIRSSAVGSPTADIGFTAVGDIDTVAMKAFVGANSAFVTIWYDQSGNARNATQATTANQPRIMNAGAIEYQNNRPALRFQDISDGLQTPAFTAFNSAACFNGVAKVNANLTGGYNTFMTKTGIAPNNNFPSPFDFYFNVSGGSMNHITGNGLTASFFNPSQSFNAAQPLGIWTFCAQLSANTASLNGSSILSAGAATTYSDRGQPLNIGKRNDGVTGLNGWVQEVVTFSTIPSATNIKYLELSQSLYYSINGPTLSAFPAGAPDAFVTTWFDQSGNGVNASQATTTVQPRIMSVGLITNNASRPAITFNGTSQTFTATGNATAFNNSAGGFLSVIGKNNSAGAVQTFAQQGRNASPWWGIWNNNASPSKWMGGFSNGPGNMVSTANSTVYSITDLMQTPAVSTQLYVNGGLQVNSGTTADHSNSQIFTIGLSNTTEYLNGSIAEIQVFALNMRNTRRKLLESNQAANYRVSISSAVYTPPSSTTYNRFVVGVGRESTTDSVAGTRSTVGMGFKVGTTASDFLKDNGDYLTAGKGCPVSAASTTANCPATVAARWLNDWYVNKTDVGSNNGNLQFYFDFSDNGVPISPGTAANYELLYRSTPAGNFTIVPGTTKSVSGDQVLFLLDAANVTTNFYYTLGTRSVVASPLPVELLGFTAERDNNTARLSWATASEKNSKYFLVQRLNSDGLFENIGDPIIAAGYSNTKRDYMLTDKAPKAGTNYYRLQMVDKDGSNAYSEIKSVEFDAELAPTVFPNPGKEIVTVFNCRKFDNLSVHNVLGQVVYKANIQGNQAEIDMTLLPDGIYFLVLLKQDGTTKSTFKLLKQ